MYLKRLNLINFKNYNELDVELCKGINCFVGENGEGKTNLFDSIYYLAFCKSYFNPADSQNIRHQQEFFVIQGEFEKNEQVEKIYCGLKRGHKKQFKRNGNEYPRLAEHIGLIPLVMVSPSDAALIIGSSDERRKYVNGVISQFDKQYLDNLIRYNKALFQRNKLLKEFARKKRFDEESLEIWDRQLAQLAEQIYEKRMGFMGELLPIFRHYYDLISQGHERVDLIYQSQGEEGGWLDLIHGARAKDRVLQYSTIGIHRDDLKLNLKGYPIRRQGSQGQQKTFLLALKLAQYDFLKSLSNIKPLILLDDVFDKLDNGRVTQLIKLLGEEHFGQTFITDKNRKHLIDILDLIPIEHKVFNVHNGELALTQNGDKED